jgi:tRNA-dihydrouridine synthase
VGNGDVECFQSYQIMKEKTGVDAVMIGRAAQGNPKMFSEIWKSRAQTFEDHDYYGKWRGRNVKINTYETIREYSKVLLDGIEQLGTLGEFWNNDKLKFTELHRNIFWMLRGNPNTHKMKPEIGKMREFKELFDYIFSLEFENDLKNAEPIQSK